MLSNFNCFIMNQFPIFFCAAKIQNLCKYLMKDINRFMYSDTKREIFHETGQTVDMTIKQTS